MSRREEGGNVGEKRNMEKISFSWVIRPLRNIAVAGVPLILFFFFYNTFIVDRTIEDLRFSLYQTAHAYDLGDLAGMDVLLDQILAEEIVPHRINYSNVGNLEYARKTIRGKEKYQLVEFVDTSIRAVLEEKESGRTPALRFLDRINWFFTSSWRNFIGRIGGIFSEDKEVIPVQEGTELYNRGVASEKNGELREALEIYRDLVSGYPSSDRAGAAKLRMAVLYARMDDYGQAREMLRRTIAEYPGRMEGYVARSILYGIGRSERVKEEEARLLSDVGGSEGTDPDRTQELFYDIGVLNLKIYKFEEAKKFFRRAYEIDPESETGKKAWFNYLWVLKEMGESEGSEDAVDRLIDEDAGDSLVLDSLYQKADMYAGKGEFEKAIEIYVMIADLYKDDSMAALCLFQAGASYMFDMNDDEKAQEIFKRLTKEYPDSPYAGYLAPDKPTGIFITYLVPRATRVVAWRVGGLLSLSGYSGRIAKFRSTFEQEDYMSIFNDWLDKELPDTVGNIYVDITGAELEFMGGAAKGSGNITMGQHEVRGEAEGRFQIDRENTLELIVTKVFIDKIPILPALINISTRGLWRILRKSIPVIIDDLRMEEGLIVVEGSGSERMIRQMKEMDPPLAGRIDLFGFETPEQEARQHAFFREEFPVSDFSTDENMDTESLFFDYFTRLSLYVTFKLMETTKDTKLDYERSVRTLGRLLVKRTRFRVRYTEEHINSSFNELLKSQFPWVLGESFLFDITGFSVRFRENGDIEFDFNMAMGETSFPVIAANIQSIEVKSVANLKIDPASGIPVLNFKSLTANGESLPVEKANLISRHCLSVLEYARLPFRLEEITVNEGEIILKGEGARDLLERIFSDPYLFVIFRVRDQDLPVAGIRRLENRPEYAGDYWRPSWGN